MKSYYSSTNILTSDNKLIIASCIGSIFEFFDFLSFVFLSPILANLFFPQHGIVFAYLTITVSYLARPLGGILFGHMSDKYGRKTVFILTIFLMAMPSLIIGMLPVYQQVGMIAPILLVVVRFIQGVSLGAEFPNAVIYIVEKFKDRNYFFYSSWLVFGANIGITCGLLLVHFLTKYTTPEFMNTLGWRIPFIIGGLLAVVGLYIRKSFTESPEFQEVKLKNKSSRVPFLFLLKHYKFQTFCGVWLFLLVSLFTSIFHIFLPSILVNNYNFDLSDAVSISAFGTIVLALWSVIFAYLTKYINPEIIVKFCGFGLIACLIFILIKDYDVHIFSKSDNVKHLERLIIVISIFIAGLNGILFGYLARLFPTEVRCSGVSICYNFAYILGAGITPLWTSSLLQITNGSYKYIIAVCLIVTILFFSTFNLKVKFEN
jgi:MFS family permease